MLGLNLLDDHVDGITTCRIVSAVVSEMQGDEENAVTLCNIPVGLDLLDALERSANVTAVTSAEINLQLGLATRIEFTDNVDVHPNAF